MRPHQLPEITDRLAIRQRPPGLPIMYQSWDKLLFMHWQMPAQILRHLIPDRLTIDTFDGTAWIGLTPFTVCNAHPIFTPPLPFVSNFHEINVRTYVSLDGVPGVWFFSLDANSLIAVTAARSFFHLPYWKANISLEQRDRTIIYASTREEAESPAEFNCTWTINDALPEAEPGSLDSFLIERYCLYTSNEEKLYRCRIHHQPWPLQRAELLAYASSMIEANKLPTPVGEPVLHCGGPVDVEIWPLQEI